jgi:hypothetical protein
MIFAEEELSRQTVNAVSPKGIAERAGEDR